MSLDPRFAGEVGALARLDELTAIVWRAAAAVLTIDPAKADIRLKADRTPVSNADLLAQTILLDGLAQLMPGLPMISEESRAWPQAAFGDESFALIDPLDGTREFLAGRAEFTVNLAIVIGGVPMIGVIAAPALRSLWRGIVGRTAEFLQGPPEDGAVQPAGVVPIKTRPWPASGLTAAVSRSHFDAASERLLSHFPVIDRIVCGSSLKFCRLAEGQADLYPRLAPVCEWDIAAGHAIVTAAGGRVVSPEGGAVRYGGLERGFRLNGFVACGDPAALPAIVDAVRLS